MSEESNSKTYRHIDSQYLLAPVTALRFHGTLLLAGEGPDLHIYCSETGNKLLSFPQFLDVNIHGIVISDKERKSSDERLLCVFGSKKLVIAALSTSHPFITVLGGVVELPDHIWEAAWLSGVHPGRRDSDSDDSVDLLDRSTLACVLGHNAVVHLRVPSATHLQEVHCAEKCIIYCARCVGNTWKELVVASGTVFNQIVLWKPAHAEKTQRAEVLHRLRGHQGVIFSIAFSHEKNLLCSVSDDRSLRLWRAVSSDSGASNHATVRQMAAELGTETLRRAGGAGVAAQGSILHGGSEDVEFVLCRTLYGHSARVWDALLLHDYVISVGEDATCCVWSYEGEILQKFKGHKGKSIWSVAAHPGKRLIATGGGDASIKLWSLDTAHSCTVPYSAKVLEPCQNEADLPRTVAFLDKETVLVMTNDGLLLSYHRCSDTWDVLFQDEHYKSYTVVACHRRWSLVALGNIHGTLTLLRGGRSHTQRIYSGKLFSLVWLGDEGDYVTHLLTTGPDGALDIWKITVEDDEISVHSFQSFTLPYTKQRWVTSAVLLRHGSMLVCGDRGGTVHVYCLKTQKREPSQSLWKIHGKSGVTDIREYKQQIYTAGRDGQYRIYDVGEGRIALLSANRVLKGFEWIARLVVVDGEIIVLGFYTDKFIAYNTSTCQQVLQVHCGGGHRAWEFRLGSDEFYSFIYIKTRNVALCEGKLNSCQEIIKPSLHAREVCDVKYVCSDHVTLSLPQVKLGGEFIKLGNAPITFPSHKQDVEYCHVCSAVDGDSHILATAGEDTMIKLISIATPSQSSCTYDVIATLQGHLSSVRALSLSGKAEVVGDTKIDPNGSPKRGGECDKSRSCILFSAGGRAELKAWKIHRSVKRCRSNQSATKSIAPAVADVSPSENSAAVYWHEYLTTHMLMDKYREKYKPWKETNWDPDPEARYMDLTSFPMNDVIPQAPGYLHCVVAACSDAFIRVFRFNERTRLFRIIAQSDMHDHCVLKVTHVFVDSSPSNKNGPEKNSIKKTDFSHVRSSTDISPKQACILSAGTDGKIALWDITYLVVACALYETQGFNCGDASLRQTVNSIDVGEIMTLTDPKCVLHCHQSGVNSLDVTQLKGESPRLLVCSGGDDNSLRLTLVQAAANGWSMCQQSALTSAHSAQITGLKILDSETVLTTSIDQRMNVWTLDSTTLEASLSVSKLVHVSDVSNLDVWMDGNEQDSASLYAVISGVGIQLLKVAGQTV